MKEYVTLEKFVHEHPNEVIEIMSPGGYVTIHPDMQLTGLLAHAGEAGIEMAVSWDELREQVVEACNYNEADGRWYLLSAMPSQDCPIQAPEMLM
jgi:hypothetical protein